MSRVFIIHGWQSNPQEGWKPWLKGELEKLGFEVHVPLMPNADYPNCEEWTNHLQKVVGAPKPNDIFVGHSLGCIAILKYLETHNQSIAHCIFVAGFLRPIGYSELDSFFTKKLDYNKIRKNSKTFTAIFSDNDKYISLDHANDFKKYLNAKIIIEKNMFHFDAESGIKTFPLLLRLIKELLH